MNNVQILEHKIQSFKRKLLLNILLKSATFFVLLFLSLFLVLNYLEYFLYLPAFIKTVFVFSFLILLLFLLIKQIVFPIRNYLQYEKTLTNEFAAKAIGNHFPDIKDKLLNTIQLQTSNYQNLASYSVDQRAEFLKDFDFDFAINNKENKKVYSWLVFPFILLIFTLLYNSNILLDGSQRLLDFNNQYQPPIPFEIELLNGPLNAYKNESFEIKFNVGGEFISDKVYIDINGVRKKPTDLNDGNYSYKISTLNSETNFKINVSGFNSENFTIKILERPSLVKSSIKLNFPNYLNQNSKTLENLSNITIPEGTELNFYLKTFNANTLSLTFSDSTTNHLINEDNYQFRKIVTNNTQYEIGLKNEHSSNKNEFRYNINVIKDKVPSIQMKAFEDTNLYEYIIVDGLIEDDYGFSRLNLKYRVNESSYKTVKIDINKNQPSQNYFYNLRIDSLKLTQEDKLEYYLEVWDNDAVNGSKKASSIKKTFKLPDLESVKENIKKESKDIEKGLDKNLEQLKKQKEENQKLEESLKQKKKLDWQDRKNIEEQLKNQEKLRNELEKLNEQFKDLNKKQDKLTNQSEEIKEKTEKLQKLMDEVLDEETKKLYDELQKLLQENKPKDEDIKKALDEINKKEENLEKELDRALELMKQLKIQLKTEELANKLEELAKKEEKLSEESLKKDANNEDLKDKQEKIKEEFNKAKEDIKELDKLNNELNNKEDEFEKETSEEKQNAENEMNNSSEQLQKNQKKKASESQKNAAEEMQKMSDQLMDMAMSGEAEQTGEDLKTLRAILENLVTLSFNQESLMDKFKKIKSVNPQFVEHSAEQIKIKDDSKIIEDSLLALASRNFQIEAFVTDELFEMNNKIDESLEAIRNREISKITVNQHLAMTSMNNLALLLSDVAEQMQQQMAKQMEGNQQCNKPKNKPGGKKLSQLQSELGKKISDLKKSGKQGKEMSEELAKLAAEQEAIREALKEMEKEGGQKAGDNGKLEKMMEENEKDLVNKKLLNMSQQRQEEIMTRLLKSEKAMRERDLDEKREAEKARQTNNNIPPGFEEYLKEKEKQIELLKTVSPEYSPYYKKEIKEYFENETK